MVTSSTSNYRVITRAVGIPVDGSDKSYFLTVYWCIPGGLGKLPLKLEITEKEHGIQRFCIENGIPCDHGGTWHEVRNVVIDMSNTNSSSFFPLYRMVRELCSH